MTMTGTFPLPPLPRVNWRNRSDSIAARLSNEAPRIPWDVFIRKHFDWRSGEHVAAVGPTGQGKTTLLLNILPLHPFVVVFATKPRDESMDRLVRTGYTRLPRWRSISARDMPRRVLWPDASHIERRALGSDTSRTGIDSVEKQRVVFTDAMARIYREGDWTVAIDELRYFVDQLRMADEIRLFLLQGRSLGISLVTATQRPRFVPLEVYDQSTHLFFWRDNDEDNLRRLSGINARSAPLIRTIVRDLERFQVLYINTRTGNMLRTRVPPVSGKG